MCSDKILELEYFLRVRPELEIYSVSYDVYKVKNRIIYSPCEGLKRAQRYLKKYINWVYPLELTTNKCAKVHSGKKWVLKMDIKDFYGSVRFEDIRNVISRLFPYRSSVVTDYLVDLVTISNKLPVGAPTSAHIANACFLPLDRRIKDYCNWHDVTYSRYMDDLTFSADSKNSLNSVEYYISDIVQDFGFRVNKKKTRYISANKQQNVLGIVVNKEVRIPKTLRRKIRAMIYHCAMANGYIVPRPQKYALFPESDLNRLKGYMNYAKSVDIKTYMKFRKYSKKLNVLKEII